jgi:acetyl esterase/lipase
MCEPAGSGTRAYLRAQAREQRRVWGIEPMAPPALLARVGRWFAATLSRELAWQLSLLDGLLLGLWAAIGGRRHRLGRLVGMILGSTLLFHLRHAITAHRSAGAVEGALDGLPAAGSSPRMPLSHVLLPPLMFRASHLEIERGRVYSEPDGSPLRLDIYRPDPSIPAPAGSPPLRRPAIIQVHGGGWLSGSRLEQGIPLLNQMAALGWVGFNIDYRLSPQATWPDHIVDVKRAIAWVRVNAAELGIDPDLIAITGGSAGGHLSALAGVTANDPAFQPGFDEADTSLLAAVPFYGVYDLTNDAGHYYPELGTWAFEKVVMKRPLDGNRELYEQASPLHQVHPGAPPFLVIHGERDTLTPVGDARDFVARLEEVSDSGVRYIELPGAEHAFDLWPSVRTARVADGIGRFLGAIVSGRVPGPAPATAQSGRSPVPSV